MLSSRSMTDSMPPEEQREATASEDEAGLAAPHVDEPPRVQLGWARPFAVRAGAVSVSAGVLASISLVVGHFTGRLLPPVLIVLGLHASVLCALGGPLVLLGVVRDRVRPRSPAVAAALAGSSAAAVVLLPWIILGRELVAGEWIRRQPFAPWIEVSVPLVGVLAVAALAALREGLRSRPIAFEIWSSGLVLLGVGLGLADALAYPGLYPWPHRVLYLHAGLALLIGLFDLLGEGLEWKWSRLSARSSASVAGVLGVGLVLLVGLGLTPSATARAGLISAAETPAEVVLPWLPQGPQNSVQRALVRMPTVRKHGASTPHPWHGRARSVILVVVDNLRADALPPVRGPDSPLVKPGDTPFLEQWLSQQFRFRRAYSQASATARSVPAMHRSVLPWEGVEWKGLSLPELASHYGLQSVAVLPEYFVFPTNAHAQSLPEGFQHLAIYSYAHQEELVRRADQVFSDLGDERFLAWIHFFCVHQPGSFYGHLLSHRDGDTFFRYRRGVEWLDTQMKILVENLKKRGLYDQVAIILAADHGDEQRQGGLGHGQFVSEQELNVPLALRVPGAQGTVLTGPVSNIDLMPTALDLLGLEPHPTHRGRSLLPLLTDEGGGPGRIAYAESASGHAMALYSGRYKLVMAPKEGAYSVFDLERDPETRDNLFGRDPERDGALLAEMVARKPEVFAGELEGKTLALLVERLGDADEDWPESDIRLLLQLARLSGNSGAESAAFALYQRTPRGEADGSGRGRMIRLEVLSALAASAPERTSALIVRELGLADPAEEAEFVSGLADRAQGSFAESFVVRHLGTLDEDTRERRRAWLRLIAPWQKNPDRYLKPLAKLRRLVDDDEISLVWWLRNLASLGPSGTSPPRPSDRALSPRLGSRVERYLRHPDGRVQLQAARALGALGGKKAISGLRRLLRNGRIDPPTHEAALVSLVALQGSDAMDVLLAQDPRSPHVLTVVRVLASLRDPRGIPMLEKIRRVSTSQTSRKEAGLTLERFEKLGLRRPSR